jgi:hypothetical protein
MGAEGRPSLGRARANGIAKVPLIQAKLSMIERYGPSPLLLFAFFCLLFTARLYGSGACRVMVVRTHEGGRHEPDQH